MAIDPIETTSVAMLPGGVQAGDFCTVIRPGVGRVDVYQLSLLQLAYALPIATSTTLGGVKPGSGVTIAADGTISVAAQIPSQPGMSFTLTPATTTQLGGIKPDNITLTVTSSGVISVVGDSASALPNISTVGGLQGTDIDAVTRGTSDYSATQIEKAAFYRKTPAGSRTVALATGATTVTLTLADNDKIVAVTGSVGGTLTVDGTVTDGWRCQVINNSSAALTYSGITGLGGVTTLGAAAATWVTLANAVVTATNTPTIGGAAPFARGTYSAPGAISPANTLAVLTVGGAYTLAAPTSNAQSMLIKLLDHSTDATISGQIDGQSLTVTLTARPAGVIGNSLLLIGSVIDNTWFVE